MSIGCRNLNKGHETVGWVNMPKYIAKLIVIFLLCIKQFVFISFLRSIHLRNYRDRFQLLEFTYGGKENTLSCVNSTETRK